MTGPLDEGSPKLSAAASKANPVRRASGAEAGRPPGAGAVRLSLAGRPRSAVMGSAALGVLDPERAAAARATIRGWPDYAPTPLVPLAGLARLAGVAEVWCKDETDRFGIGAFKALGGAYAVMCALRDEIGRLTGRSPSPEALARGHPIASEVTTVTASAGNHGRSVAWGSERFGCRCVVFLPDDAAPARAAAIRSHGARVVRFDGDYDGAVEAAGREAARRGWIVVSDTAYPGYEEIPRRVMEGYTLLADEMAEQLAASGVTRLTHVFVQAGVGGLATGVCGGLWARWRSARPRFIAVEPWRADAFGRSLRRGRRSTVPAPFETAMGGLASGVPSTLAWRLLEGCLDAAVAIPEAAWRSGQAALAGGDLGVALEAGPSGAAGVGALLSVSRLPSLARALQLDPEARVGVLVTERRFE